MRAIALPARLRRRSRQQDIRPAVAEKLLAAPVAAPVMKTGERPYPDTIAASQVTAYRIAALSEFYIPRPGFEAAPGRAPATAPMQALPDNVKVPPPPPAPVPARVPAPARHAMAAGEAADLRLLNRVHGAMERKWRAESFIADKRELPCFAATTKAVGWLGMHMPSQPAGWRRWSTEPWAAREQELADAALRNARAMVLGELSDIRTRVDDSLHAAGGAR
jgi:hypothetical protein